MIKNKIIFEIFIILILLFSIGCSKSDSLVQPSSGLENESEFYNSGLGISDISDGKIKGGIGTLGLFQARINSKNLTGEMVPIRSSMLTDVLESVDITGFMTVRPCVDCVKLQSIGLNPSGDLVLTIGIKHPYDAGDPEEDVSGRNRADLHLFNVEGTIIGESGDSIEFAGLGEKVEIFRLLNADGYSGYLDASIDEFYPTAATIHPYILHFDSYDQGNFNASVATGFQSVTYPLPFGNLVMPMGSDYDYKDYIFRNPGDNQLEFLFAVNCTFGLSAESLDKRFTPVYRIPQFNKKSASELDVRVKEFNLVPGDTESSVKIEVRVVDISHGVETGTDLNKMAFDSSVDKIVVDVPGMLTAPVTIEDPTPVGGNGHSPENPLIYEITLQNTAGGTSLKYPALVKVVDSYPPASNTFTAIAGKDGISRVEPGGSIIDGLFTIDEFATYQTLIIEAPGNPPVCEAVSYPSPAEVEQGTPITFDGSGSYDDDYIKSYEWDFDYDGINFDIDATGQTIEAYICEPGQHEVALKVIDSDDNEEICSTLVIINPDDESIDGWGIDRKILGNESFEPFILNTSNRAIAVYKDDVYIVMNSNIPINASENIYFMRSDDRGNSWDPPVQVTKYPDSNKAWTREANLAIDRLTGDIYIQYESDAVSYQTNQSYKMDVFVTASKSKGNLWSDSYKVNPEEAGQSDEMAGSIAINDYSSPAIIYIGYENRASTSDFNIYVASTTSTAINNWTAVKVDDSATKSMHPSIYVNPVDKSVNIAWVNPKNLGGTGVVLFDRSIDDGQTWGTDVTVYNIETNSSNTGPFETCLAIEPSSGIPGVMWRDTSTQTSKCFHRFSKATVADGSAWGNAISLSDGSTLYCWSGTLSVGSDGRWAAIFEQDQERLSKWYAMFTESKDDGVSWSTPVRVDDTQADNAGWVFGLSMVLDECRNAHVVWGDTRAGIHEKNELYYDFGT